MIEKLYYDPYLNRFIIIEEYPPSEGKPYGYYVALFDEENFLADRDPDVDAPWVFVGEL